MNRTAGTIGNKSDGIRIQYQTGFRDVIASAIAHPIAIAANTTTPIKIDPREAPSSSRRASDGEIIGTPFRRLAYSMMRDRSSASRKRATVCVDERPARTSRVGVVPYVTDDRKSGASAG